MRRPIRCGTNRSARPTPVSGRAFTLIEVLIVLALVSLLAALILPALFGARQATEQQRALAMMQMLKTKLGMFKDQFGSYPPSSIMLREDGVYGDDADKYKLRKLWPRILLAGQPGFTPWDFDGGVDSNGDGNADNDVFRLDGAQCLVFFLAGMPDPVTWVGRGFSRDPTNPFQMPDKDALAGKTIGRVGPFFEVNTDKLLPDAAGPFARLADPLGTDRPIAYFSSYEGGGYVPGECAFVNPYQKGTGGVYYEEPSTFQLISAGADGLFDTGGVGGDSTAPTQDEQDNLVSFLKTRLGDYESP